MITGNIRDKTEEQYVVFFIDEHSFAIPVEMVDSIKHSVNITRLPGMPANVSGVINIHGQIIPVFNIRRIFGLDEKETAISDKIIISFAKSRKVAFITDRVTVVTDKLEQKVVLADQIYPGMQKIIDGLVFYEDGMILIYNLQKFFDIENEEVFDLAIKKHAVRTPPCSKQVVRGRTKPGKAPEQRTKDKAPAKVKTKETGELKKKSKPQIRKRKK